MDAKELHRIYAPLWEKVPNAKPRRIHCAELTTGGWSAVEGDGGPIKVYGYEFRLNDTFEPIPAGLAADACRVAVEDWLHKNSRGGLRIDRHPDVAENLDDPDIITYIVRLYKHCDDGEVGYGGEYEWPGPTPHHALVACALAVAASK